MASLLGSHGCIPHAVRAWADARLVSLALMLQVLQIHGQTNLPFLGSHDPGNGHGPTGQRSWKPAVATAASNKPPASAAEMPARLTGISRSRS